MSSLLKHTGWTILLHYLDECHELVVLPDRVLDDEDDIREYEKYIR